MDGKKHDVDKSMGYVDSIGRLWIDRLPFHGENTGSSPVGRANEIKGLADIAATLGRIWEECHAVAARFGEAHGVTLSYRRSRLESLFEGRPPPRQPAAPPDQLTARHNSASRGGTIRTDSNRNDTKREAVRKGGLNRSGRCLDRPARTRRKQAPRKLPYRLCDQSRPRVAPPALRQPLPRRCRGRAFLPRPALPPISTSKLRPVRVTLRRRERLVQSASIAASIPRPWSWNSGCSCKPKSQSSRCHQPEKMQ